MLMVPESHNIIVVAWATRAEEQGNPKLIRPGSILVWFIH
jgi:hypothetical protein